MELLARIAQVIVPVFLIVAIGFAWGRRHRPELAAFNRIVLDVVSPLLVQGLFTLFLPVRVVLTPLPAVCDQKGPSASLRPTAACSTQAVFRA